MTTQTIHPPTSHGAHAGPPGSDPHQIITDLRQSLAAVPDLQQQLDEAQTAAEAHESMELVLRNALKARDALAAELGLRLVRAEEALADLAAQAWRQERENERLSAENRRLRDRLPRRGGRGRRRRLP